MNILPKKSWHVRRKENIARVRRDVAKAAEEEKEKQRRAQLAESEARNALLREKARLITGNEETPPLKTEVQQQKHVNFFEDLEQGNIVSNATNAEHEREKKEEREKYEKQIGYLTYLGQDTVETTGNISWYNKVPDRDSSENTAEPKKNILGDPLSDIRRYLGFKEDKKQKHETEGDKKQKRKTSERDSSEEEYKRRKKARKHGHKHKDKKRRKHHKHSRPSSKNDFEITSESEEEQDKASKMQQLRAERLKREEAEKKRSEALLAKIRGDPIPEGKPSEPAMSQRYHSQFNPHLARQNKQ
ncbi:Leukocyte receptor cluster member 1 [Blattella germanica]|nr:Leukocyte receptor cluster member 1 [Blattella germanica]